MGSHQWPLAIFVVVAGFVAFSVVAPSIGIFSNSVLSDDGFTLHWYRDTLLSPLVLSATVNTAIVVVGATVIAVVIGVGLAWLVSRTDLPFARWLTVIPVMPLFFPPVVGAVAWVVLLAPQAGLINAAIRSITGKTTGPFDIYNVWGVTAVVGLYITPYVYLMIANAFRQYDSSYEEAARTAGAPMLTVLWRVTLPLLRPAITAGALLAFITAIAQFSIPALIGRTGNVEVYTTLIYDMLRRYPRELEPAAVLSSIMVVVTMVVLWIQRRLLRRSARFVTMGGKGLRRTRLALGPWRWPLFACVISYVVIAVILPMFALVNLSVRTYWAPTVGFDGLTLDNFRWVFDGYNRTVESIFNSGYLSFVGATLGMLLSVLIAFIVVRGRVKGRRALDYLATFPAAVPATVLGAGLLMIYLGPPIALYGTNALLIIAYVAHLLPQGTRTATAAFQQVGSEMDEASFVCGAGWTTTFRRIVLPLVAPLIAGGWIFLFVLMTREVSASVLIASPQTPVVSIVLLDLWGNGDVPRLAAFSVVVIALCAVLTVLVQRFGHRSGAR
ncbi:iron ABC transporter permease [Pseudonocardia zijingensis]|uniref:Iron ABC transporter permease n=1 Tax=Pseudonocardia zijingensis TaxID=153376 RepID=A0ABN1Q012_9PSEU